VFTPDQRPIDFKTSSQILASVQPILDQADCRIVNLENPLTGETDKIFKSGPNLKGERENIASSKPAALTVPSWPTTTSATTG
jgi:hypothetical protein